MKTAKLTLTKMATQMISTPIADVVASNYSCDAEQNALKAFGDLNGWNRTNPSHYGFNLWTSRPEKGELTRAYGGMGSKAFTPWSFGNSVGDVFDHTRTFRLRRRAVAVITQPYDHYDLADLPKWWGKLGGKDDVELKWHIPPNSKASCYFPGRCYFLVLTRPDMTVQWLPEQEN